MPININSSLTTNNVTNYSNKVVTVQGSPYNAGQFDTPRIIGLWTSGGQYRGVMNVRRFINANQVELENDFVTRDGEFITANNGDVAHLSLAPSDVSQAGFLLDNNIITQTDNVIFGSGGQSDSCCFYAEGVTINVSNDGGTFPFRFEGGLSVFGHLLNYEDRSFFNPVNLLSADGGSNGNQINVNGTNAKIWWMGGVLRFQVTPARLPGGSAGTPAEWQKWWSIETNADLVTPGGGAPWASNAENQQFSNCVSLPSSNNAIGFRLADSDLEGGLVKITGGLVISPFGADAVASYNISAPAGRRFLILDMGTDLTKTAFWRSSQPRDQIITVTNVISTDYRFGTTVNPGSVANNQALASINFRDRFTNLQADTEIVINEVNTGEEAARSETATGGFLDMLVNYANVVGHTLTVNETQWEWAAYKYGRNIVSGSFEIEPFETLSGNAVNASFSGSVVQSNDALTTEQNPATVRNYTTVDDGLEIYDAADLFRADNFNGEFQKILSREGARAILGDNDLIIASTGGAYDFGSSPFRIRSANYQGGITTTGLVTLQGASVVSNGVYECDLQLQAGRTLTNVTQPAGNRVIITSGGTLTLDGGGVNLVENTSGNPLIIELANGAPVPNTLETSGSITIVNPMSVTVTNVQAGDTIKVTGANDVTEIFEQITGTTYNLSIPRNNDGETWRIAVDRVGFSPYTTSFEVSEGTIVSFTANLLLYRRSAGDIMYTGNTSTLISIDFNLSIPQATINIGNGSVTPQQIFDAFEQALVTSAGMSWHLQEGTIVTHDNLPGVGNILLMQSNIRLNTSELNAAVSGYILSSDGILFDENSTPIGYVGGLNSEAIASAVWSDQIEYTGTQKGKILTDALRAARIAQQLSV